MELTPETYFNTADEASSFLTGIYAILGQASFYGENYIYLEGGDVLETYGGASARTPATKGLVCVNALSSDAAVTGFWYTLYSGINRANMFLENIDKVENVPISFGTNTPFQSGNVYRSLIGYKKSLCQSARSEDTRL